MVVEMWGGRCLRHRTLPASVYRFRLVLQVFSRVNLAYPDPELVATETTSRVKSYSPKVLGLSRKVMNSEIQ